MAGKTYSRTNIVSLIIYLILFDLHAYAVTGDEFIQAARTGDIDTVNSYIENKGNVNFKDFKGQTALLHATFFGHINIIRLLIAAGADLEVRDKEGRTPLLYALANQEIDEFHNLFYNLSFLFINAGANVNICDKDGKTPLHYSANSYYANSYYLVTELLAAGADPNMYDKNRNTALVYAIKNFVGILVIAGSPIHFVNIYNESAYSLAIDETKRTIDGITQVFFKFHKEFMAKTIECKSLNYVQILDYLKLFFREKSDGYYSMDLDMFMSMLLGNKSNYMKLSCLYALYDHLGISDQLYTIITSKAAISKCKKRGFSYSKNERIMKHNLVNFTTTEYFDIKFHYAKKLQFLNKSN